jgi:hypothetical protein
MTKGKCLRVLPLQLDQLNKHNQPNQRYIRAAPAPHLVPRKPHLLPQIFSLHTAKCQETKTDLDYQQVNW